MRGGFVACAGGAANASLLELAVSRLRRHHGDRMQFGGHGLEVAAVVDTEHGPFVEAASGRTLLVHGDPAPFGELRRSGRRFAAVEAAEGIVRACRDPLAQVPLFYRVVDGTAWLATEVGPLLAVADAAPDLDALAAQAALVPNDERTGWLGVHRVLPGWIVQVDTDGRVSAHDDWRPDRLFGRFRGNREQAIAEFKERFAAAVRRCWVGNPGLLLSGGLDSSAVAVVAARERMPLAQIVHIVFPGMPHADEEHYARSVAARVGAPLTLVAGCAEPWDPHQDLDVFDIPYVSLPVLDLEPGLAQLAIDGVRTVVDGHDGDGMLGYLGHEWGELTLGLHLGRLLELARAYGAGRVLRGIVDDLVPRALRIHRGRGPLAPNYHQVTAQYFRAPLHGPIRELDRQRWRNPVGNWRASQLRQVLPSVVIRMEEDEQRAARVGVDVRHPFADRDLVELLVSLNCAVKVDPGRSKSLLRDALADLLPPTVQGRLDKPEYKDVFRRRVDPHRCLEWVRESGVRLPLVDYEALFRDAERVPLTLWVLLARAHVFAAAARA